MAVRCPKCGAQYDVTLFTFDRAIRCDCGAWVDLSVGHREPGPDQETRHAARMAEAASADDDVLLAVCRTAYRRAAVTRPADATAARSAVAAQLRRAGYELDERSNELAKGSPTLLAVLADGRSVHRRPTGQWLILRPQSS